MPTPSRILDRLDEVFDALDAGDREGAERLMELVRRKGADTAEAHAAEGALARYDGDLDAALEWLRRAAERDPDWSLPVVEMAMVHLDRDEPELALEVARRALDGVPEDDEERDLALVVGAGALLDLDRPDEAIELLDELLDREPSDPMVLAELGSMLLLVGDPEAAAATLESAVQIDPELDDAWAALGHALFETEEPERAIEAWLETRRLDLLHPRPEWRLDDEAIERIAERALRELPESVREHLRDVPILVSDAPSEEMIRDGINPRVLGLFSGTPLPEKSHDGASPTSPDACHVFVRNLENDCADREELERELRVTILHETAHFFGLEDEDLEDIGLG